MKKMLSVLLALIIFVSVTPISAYGAIQYKYTCYISGQYCQTKARSMLEMVNELRAENGVKPLDYSYLLENNVMLRAAETAICYSHTRPNGTKCFFNGFGDAENVGDSHRDIGIVYNVSDGKDDVQWSFDGWKQSPGHKANMINPDYHAIAISCFMLEDGTELWVQQFERGDTTGKRLIDGEYVVDDYTEPCDDKAIVPVEIISSNIHNIEFSSSIDNINLEYSFDSTVPAVKTNKRYYFDYTWKIADESIAQIVDDKLVAKAVGTTQMTATMLKGADKQVVTVPITVTQADVSNASLEIEYGTAEYDKSAKTPSVKSLTLNGLDVDSYDVSYENNINPGTASVVVTGKDNYKGTIRKNFSIVCNHKDTTILKGKSATCTENGATESEYCNICNTTLKSADVIKALNHKLVKTSDEIKATCTQNGVSAGYACTRCDYVVAPVETNKINHKLVKTSDEVKATCTQNGITAGYACADCDYVIGPVETYKLDHTIVINKKSATKKSAGYIKQSCSECDQVISNVQIPRIKSVALSDVKYVYNGKVRKPSVVIKDSEGNKISSKNYTVKYSKGRKYVGKYNVTIKFKGNYSGTVTKSFVINPKPVKAKTLSALKKGFKVKWSKSTKQVSGYQIQYATNSKFKKAKTITAKNNKTTSKKVTNLKAKKKYYVRVRTYKTVNGTKYYSSWSKPKMVKIQ